MAAMDHFHQWWRYAELERRGGLTIGGDFPSFLEEQGGRVERAQAMETCSGILPLALTAWRGLAVGLWGQSLHLFEATFRLCEAGLVKPSI